MAAIAGRRERARVLEFYFPHAKAGYRPARDASFQLGPEIGMYSSSNRGVDVTYDAASLRQYHEPATGTDLTTHVDTFHYEPMNQNGDLGPLIECVRRAKADGSLVTRPNVICFRGSMNRIMSSCVSQDAWDMTVCKRDGIVFINDRRTTEQIANDANMTREAMTSMYMGYRFEQVCTQDTDVVAAGPPVMGSEFVLAVAAKMCGYMIIMGAEVDCARSLEGDERQWIELKTAMARIKKYKLDMFWAQSMLVGIPEIIVGVKDRNGRLVGTETYETQRLEPRNAAVYYECAAYIIRFLEQNLEEGGPARLLRCRPGAARLPQRMATSVTLEPMDPEYNFLPPDFRI